MVSKASDDLPEPESPVNTTRRSRGIERLTFFRLCSRAPRMVMWSVGIGSSLQEEGGAGGGDQAAARSLHPALADPGPPACMYHLSLRPQTFARLGRGDEAELEVEAGVPALVRHQAAHGPA